MSTARGCSVLSAYGALAIVGRAADLMAVWCAVTAPCVTVLPTGKFETNRLRQSVWLSSGQGDIHAVLTAVTMYNTTNYAVDRVNSEFLTIYGYRHPNFTPTNRTHQLGSPT